MAKKEQTPHRLYIAEFPCGVLKAGVTKLPRNVRGRQLRRDGERYSRIHYGAFHAGGFGAERDLLGQLSGLAVVVEGREWFTGVDFDRAQQIVDQVTRASIARFGLPVMPPEPTRGASRRGFASMTPEQRKRIASMGGKAAQESGNARRFTPEEASRVGRMGGKAAHEAGTAHQWTTEEARVAGRKGGSSRAPAQELFA